MANCIGAGLCRCVHYYDDGNPVPGSGSSADPYVHEKQVITGIRDFITGTPLLVPDGNRVITLPASVRCLYDTTTDTTLTPDADGCIDITTTGMASFGISDPDGPTSTITNGEIIRFGSDGGSLAGGFNAYDDVVIVGEDVIIPAQKTRLSTNEIGISFVDGVTDTLISWAGADVTTTKTIPMFAMLSFTLEPNGTTLPGTEIELEIYYSNTSGSQFLGKVYFEFSRDYMHYTVPCYFTAFSSDPDTGEIAWQIKGGGLSNIDLAVKRISFVASYV